MDVGPAILIFTPIFLPIVMNVGVDPVHFGLFAIMNLCVGSLHHLLEQDYMLVLVLGC